VIREGDEDRFLLCRIGSRICALALRDVRETMRPLPVEPLAGAPPFVLGLAIVRGSPTPVIDANQLLSSSPAPSSPFVTSSAARFVSLKLGERSVALAVDAVLDVRPLPAGGLADIPPLLRDTGADLVSVIASLDDKLLFVLEAARLVPDSVWSEIKVPGAAA
jgi:purine-binding chemotaxis protein CheW